MKFKKFLESIKTDENAILIEAIAQGIALMETDESEKQKIYKKTITFDFRNYGDAVKQIMDLYKTEYRGILVLDPEGDMEEPITSFVIPQRTPRGMNRYFIDVDITDPDDDKNSTCTIIIKSDEQEQVDKTAKNIKKLFENIGSLGNCGHYFEIRFIPVNNRVKSKSIGWDGDGSDYMDVDSIKIS